MIVLWMALLFLHRGYSLVPVKTVQLGEAATLTCALPDEEISSRKIYWYKQSVGDALKFIVTLYGTTELQFASEFSKSRFGVQIDKNFSSLTIWRTVQDDEGIYHCGIDKWINIKWNGTYLLIKGNTQRTSNYIVVQQPVEPNPVRPGDTADLQCSVFSDSETKTCPGDHNVFWFRAGSHPNIIYTDGNSTNQCGERSETQQKRCVYHFSKNIGSSDSGTYYCALATCGEILFGNGTKLDIQVPEISAWPQMTLISLLCPVLVLIVIAVLIYTIRKNGSDYNKAAVQQKNFSDQKREQNKDTQMFSAVVFTMMNADAKKDTKAAEKRQIYTAVKAFGLD